MTTPEEAKSEDLKEVIRLTNELRAAMLANEDVISISLSTITDDPTCNRIHVTSMDCDPDTSGQIGNSFHNCKEIDGANVLWVTHIIKEGK